MYAIIIQGQHSQRTVDIVEYMIKNNNDSHIILSVWNNFDLKLYNPMMQYPNFHLILNDPITLNYDIQHRNSQRITSFRGIELALKLNCQWVLKMRSDNLHRIPNICSHLLTNYLHKFSPPIHKDNLKILNNRIICPNGGTTYETCWGDFHISDFWLFGNIHDLYHWYDLNTNIWNGGSEPYFINKFNPNIKSGLSPEPDFVQTWMHFYNIQCSDMSELIGRYFIVVNNEDLDFIFKTQPLDLQKSEVSTFWQFYGDIKTIRHHQWLSDYLKIISTNQ